MTAAGMRTGEILELTDSTRQLLRELAAVHAEGEALRRELEMAWGPDEVDERPTLVPELDENDFIEVTEVIEIERRDTLRC